MSSTLLRDGTLDYEPEPGFVGDDAFTYTATNLSGAESTPARVALRVTAPVAPPPTFGDATPADGARITEPVPVTANVSAADGDAVDRWSVTARDLDGGAAVTLTSGHGAPPHTLATFDPTTLGNGAYEIRIQATSANGGTGALTRTAVVAGDMKLGDYATTYDDLDATVGGIPLSVRRTYDTLDHRDGDFGHGWHVGLTSYRATPNGRLGQGGWSATASGFPFTQLHFKSSAAHFVTVTSPSGHVDVFTFQPADSSPLLGLTSPTFAAVPGSGTTSTLEDADPPVLVKAGSDMRGFLTGEVYDPQVFRLTQGDGTVVTIDRMTGLRSVVDLNGSEFVVGPDGHSLERHWQGTRDHARRGWPHHRHRQPVGPTHRLCLQRRR